MAYRVPEPRDPDGRYRRLEVIGNGAFKIVYRAYDQAEGIEVAWNEIRTSRGNEAATGQIYKEIELLGSLDHPRILRLFHAWIDRPRGVLVFITEFFTNGTVRSYVDEVCRKPTRSVISKWCKQILEALNYMHTHDPPVIHRDLKCDNLFIDASEGIVKIGDFGLSREMPTGQAASKLGTPAYTAPEVYSGNYTTKADIWSFGMCVLEMVTAESPYSEYANLGAIYMAVTSAKLPASLMKVEDPVIADFITSCLVPQDVRPSAGQLLEHPLIVEYDQGEDEERQPELSQRYGDLRTPQLPEPDFVEPLDNLEYQTLITRQQVEVEQLMKRQKMERKAERMRLRRGSSA